MSEHLATILWRRGNAPFTDNRYDRVHEWRFDGGAVIAASPSPSIVRPPMSDPSAVDPEEAYVASLASCHMLWFLDLARQAGFVVDRYEDAAVGWMERRAEGGLWIARVELSPQIDWAPPAPTRADIAALHDKAHESCFIANSVKTQVTTRLD